MFKKEPHIKALSNLKNSERKKLQEKCRIQTSNEEYSFGSNTIKQTNFKGITTIGTIYTDEGNAPIWFKEKHDEKLYPTVLACWRCPNLIPVVLTHSIVLEDHIFNGANLMISGTIPPFDERLTVGTVCGIADKRTPNLIVAVGIVQMNLPSFTRVIGETGVAVQIVHHLEDELFKVFKVKEEPPVELLQTQSSSSEELELEADIHEDETKVESNSDTEKEKSNLDDMAEVLDELRLEDIDYFITRALYYTISQDTKLETPTSASNFVSNHINHNLPKGTNLAEVNIKKSSWKKTAKFLKHFEKEGFLKLKGVGDDLTIVEVNKDKDEIKQFLPYPVIGNQGSNTGSEGGNAKTTIKIVTLYKPINLAKDFISSNKVPLKQLYTEPEIKELINKYITTKDLVDKKDKKCVLVDDMLMTMIYKKKEDQATKSRVIPRANILQPVLQNNFNKNYHLFRITGNEQTPLTKTPLKGEPPKINIVTEMKIGRKVITKVSNFEVFQIDPEEFAADIRKKCSGSTTIGETTSSAKKTAEVQVQGPHGQLIISYLNDLGIPNKWIDFENKLKNKKKRK
ncbi:Translation machinery-associated protein 64 [Nakaseomyces glabratus]|uniref:Translation machinery-associated protein 64 n=1 Tax=Candida glabrata TaxID=5478 RepID=A0A0W0D1A1_CANGB|nr:Translation machinery-associated protein 64 [Nakaseomyces glabratus]KTB05621.1 Translation machinery-associated protein 64 [Nakaseomyces glabratus]KTB10228.1 Translation machinery-associated protein 64 [Nakaseomyces glabratus]KTB22780.1 Translation machinery-associated protein 64 [Nakaseomyces glabratus]